MRIVVAGNRGAAVHGSLYSRLNTQRNNKTETPNGGSHPRHGRMLAHRLASTETTVAFDISICLHGE